jgi:predicted alpha/beta superfamily hydrolase
MKNDTLTTYTVDGCFELVLYSAPRNLAYRIMITEPKEAPPAQGYPVIYALDGDAVFNTLAEAARLQTRKPHGYDPVVVVGIGYPSREPFDMTRRCYDLTMPAEEENLPVRPDGRAWPEHGGADAFLDFIETILKPEIQQRYPIDPHRQTLFGHSLGGLFVLHALFSRPQTFNSYVAGSPSIWWNHHAVLREKPSFEDAVQRGEVEARLLITIGADELHDMVEGAKQLAESLLPLAAVGFHSELLKFPDEDHVSVLPAAISRVIRFTLKPS